MFEGVPVRFLGGLLAAVWIAAACGMAAAADPVSMPGSTPPGAEASLSPGRPLSLEECIDIAVKNNHRRPASQFAVALAEAQHQQALSAYWPQLAVESSYTWMDHDPNFIFPASSIQTPAVSGTVASPLGPLPINVPAQSITIPQQNVKVMDRSTVSTSLNLTLPLYTGGLRSALVRQAQRGVEVAKQEARRTDLELMYDVRRMYYGAILARDLHRLSQETLDRLGVTLELTERLYQSGSERVRKTDYLRNKTAVEGLRSITAALLGTVALAHAALTNTMGLPWQQEVELAGSGIPFTPSALDRGALVAEAYAFSPDWAKMEAALQAAEAQIAEASSGHLPKLALFGSLNHLDNPATAGLMTSENKSSWTLGVGVSLPLFNGFKTINQVREARARLARLKEQQVLLREGIALQVKHGLIQLQAAAAQQEANREAARAAEENRDLHERAYREELVETKDVIEAQLIESLIKAQYQKSLFDHIEAQARLNFVIGREVSQRLGLTRP
jgi:outer membrane protein